jgi:hypothetical protein
MHQTQTGLAPSTYTQPAVLTDAETVTPGGALEYPGGPADLDGGAFFMDCEISREALRSGDLRKRFDLIAFPQKGVSVSGVDSDGATFPPAAKPMNDK